MAKLIFLEVSQDIADFLSSKGFSKKTNLGFGKFRFKHNNGSTVHVHHDLQWIHYGPNGELKGAHTGFDKLKDYLK